MIKKIESVEELDKILIKTDSCISPEKLIRDNYVSTICDINNSSVNYAYFHNNGTLGYLRSFPSKGNQFIDYIKFFNKDKKIFDLELDDFFYIMGEIAFLYMDFQHIFIKQNKLRTHVGNLTNNFKTHVKSLDLNPRPMYVKELENNVSYDFIDLKELLI